MSRTGFLVLLGVLIVLAPLSGLPVTLRSILVVFFGVCVLGVGFSLRAHHEHTHTQTPTPEQPPQ